jgi:hypothetical protein
MRTFLASKELYSLPFIQKQHQASSTETTTSMPDGDVNYNYYDDDYNYYDDQNDWDSSVNTDSYLEQQLSAKVDEWTKRVNKFEVIHRGLDL